MKRNKLGILITFTSFLILTSCIKDVKDTIDSIECAALISKLNTDDNENCADSIADIEKIERSCGEFLDAETKELIASIKANCQDD